MGDITLRAVETLRSVSLIAAEDTRTARLLLKHLDIQQRVTSYHDYTTPERRAGLVERLAGGDVALISEAGTPTLSDPGYHLVGAALAAGHEVRPVPGPSALLAALAASGLPTDQFVFLGFLPRKPADRRRGLAAVAGERRTLVCYESPHRVVATLGDLREALGGDRRICVARELTKLYEEFFRGTIADAVVHFAEPRGEFTLVIAGAPEKTRELDTSEADDRIRELLAAGEPPATVARLVTKEFGLPRRQAYDRVRAMS